MSQPSAWFERKFDFSFPLELLPNLLARLRGTPARLEDAVRRHDHHTLIQKPQGKWSAQEHVGHLLDLEPLWLARVGDYSVGGDQLTAADLTNRNTDEANHNGRPLEELLVAVRCCALQFRGASRTARLSKALRMWNFSTAKSSAFRTKLTSEGFADIGIEPTRIYNIEDARQFLTCQGVNVDAIAPVVPGKFMKT